MEYDYASCSYDELLDVQRRVNREKYPETYAKVVAEIERRQRLPENERDRELGRIAAEQQPLFSQSAKQKAMGCVLLSFALFLFFNGVAEPIWFTVKSANWATVRCVIVYSRQGKGTPEIRYQYVVAGRTYRGRRLSSSGTLRKQRSWRREYTEGKSTSCRVNPDNPLQSTLTWGPSATALLDLLFSYLLFWIGLRAFKSCSNEEKSRQQQR